MKMKVVPRKYVIIRTHSAGVFAGYLISENGQEVVLRNARRIWKWDGAASLSQMAEEGVSRPEGCKFSIPVIEQKLYQAIECLSVSEKGRLSIQAVPEWRA